MSTVRLQDWEVQIEDGDLPDIFASYVEKANYVDQIDINNPEGRFFFLGISRGKSEANWPSMIVAQKYQDANQMFKPGVLLSPDTSIVFVGAGERLLCYDIEQQKRLWEDQTDCGFWGWSQTGKYVLMSAELEFGVWDHYGTKLWSTFVEPPWGFVIKEEIVELDVMGSVKRYNLSDGVQIA